MVETQQESILNEEKAVANKSKASAEEEEITDFGLVLQADYYDMAIDEEREVKFRSIIHLADQDKAQNDNSNAQNRIDRYNQNIKWGQKTHKITFVDQVE